jgi:hypothetical protein
MKGLESNENLKFIVPYKPNKNFMQAVTLIDRKWQAYLIAGDNYDGHVYHQRQGASKLNAVWIMEKVQGEDNWYYLFDAKHGQYLTVKDNGNESIQQGPVTEELACWQFIEVPDPDPVISSFNIKQVQTGLYIAAGMAYCDNHVYQQTVQPGELNAMWRKTPVMPSAYTYGQDSISLKANTPVYYSVDCYDSNRNLKPGILTDMTPEMLSKTIQEAWYLWKQLFSELKFNFSAVEVPLDNPNVSVRFQWGDIPKQLGNIDSLLEGNGAITDTSKETPVVTFGNKQKWWSPYASGHVPVGGPLSIFETMSTSYADLLMVCVHEIGHVLGLSHADKLIPSDSVMKEIPSRSDLYNSLKYANRLSYADIQQLKTRHYPLFDL